MQHGRAALQLYIPRLLACPSLVSLSESLGYQPIKGFRYLLQHSPPGFFHTDQFMDGFRYLGETGYSFDMTLDVTHEETGKTKILDDAIVAIERTREGQDAAQQTCFILGEAPSRSLTRYRLSLTVTLSL